MRKQRGYDFDRLFIGQNLKQTTVVNCQPKSKDSQYQRVSHLAETKQFNNYTKDNTKKITKPSIRMSSRNSSIITDSSRGSSAEKTSRKQSLSNIQLLAHKDKVPKTEITVSQYHKVDEVESFFCGLGTKTVIKYVPVALHQNKKSVKRNLINQILNVKLNNTSKQTAKTSVAPQQTTINVDNNRLASVPSESVKHQSTHHRTLENSQVRQTMQSTSRLLAHKNSYQSVASSCSSRYNSVHSNANHIRNVNDRFKQSEEKIRKLKERLSQLYHMKSEVSEKQLKPPSNNGQPSKAPRMARYQSLMLR